MSFQFFDYRTSAGVFPVDLLPRGKLSAKMHSLVEKCREIPFQENRWTSIYIEKGEISVICSGSFGDQIAPIQQVGYVHSYESQGRLLMKTMAHLHKLGYRIVMS